VLLGLGMCAAVALAGAEAIDSRFATLVTSQVGGKPVRLVLTGTAMRTKYGFSVYAIGSYVQEGLKVRNGDELAKIAAPKQLHLIFERDVDGGTMADSFRESIGLSHPAPAFSTELAKLEDYFRKYPARRGGHLWLTAIPGVGLGCQVTGKPDMVIENSGFAQAVWDLYLGRKNLGMAIKSGLTSRL
jgi:hypothetical protein